ncbi:MAG: hypothetical protein A2X64_08130 [Ignavibacteria bacterium GWF2_33_9]|nr:MAG: hypothetical protein A2X64_08130 [Ignavibacteria bacterium GWF2_33_9]
MLKKIETIVVIILFVFLAFVNASAEKSDKNSETIKNKQSGTISNQIFNLEFAGDIVINELMADNNATITDPDGGYADWIELHNIGDVIVDLGGKYLSDKADNLTKWQFPIGSTIEPNGYLLVWCDEDMTQQGLHANFKFSMDGEAAFLVDNDGTTILDMVEFGPQTTDVSYGRYPNGTGEFEFLVPTPGARNIAVGVDDFSAELSLSPNPAADYFDISLGTISGDSIQPQDITIYNSLGQLVKISLKQTFPCRIEISALPPGMYFVRFGTTNIKFIKL